MGAICSYACKACGFESPELYAGPGPFPRKYDPTLVSCAACQTLAVVHRPDVAKGCPVCHGPLRVEDEDSEVACPRCGKPLDVIPVGLWD